MSDRAKDEPLNMIGYWVGKYGLLDGPRTYYPNLIENDSICRAALAQLLVADTALRQRVSQLERDEGSDA